MYRLISRGKLVSVFLCFLSLPPPGPELPRKPWPWTARGFVTVVLPSWEGITPLPGFHPLGPSSGLEWEAWFLLPPGSPSRPALLAPIPVSSVVLMLCHTHKEMVVCEPSVVSVTSARLEQRGCVRAWFYGGFLMGNTPLYSEGRNVRRLEGSGRKETSLIWGRGVGVPLSQKHSMCPFTSQSSACGKWGHRGGIVTSSLAALRGRGAGLWMPPPLGFHSGLRAHQGVHPSLLGLFLGLGGSVWGWECERRGCKDSPANSSFLEWFGILQLTFLQCLE